MLIQQNQLKSLFQSIKNAMKSLKWLDSTPKEEKETLIVSMKEKLLKTYSHCFQRLKQLNVMKEIYMNIKK